MKGFFFIACRRQRQSQNTAAAANSKHYAFRQNQNILLKTVFMEKVKGLTDERTFFYCLRRHGSGSGKVTTF